MGLLFKDNETLQVAIKSGHLPANVVTNKAKLGYVNGNIIITPDKDLTATQKGKLRLIGVGEATQPNNSSNIDTLLEAVSLSKVPTGETPSLALLVMKTNKVIDVAAELLRLGCDRQEYMINGDLGLIRVVDPPTYTIVRAIDHEDGIVAYVPSPTGQESRWVEIGYRHPLEDRIEVEKGNLLLLNNSKWNYLPENKWLPLDAALSLVITGGNQVVKPGKMPARRQVNLRLATGRRESPSLWVIRDNAVAVVDKLLSYLPDTIMERLTFAVTNHANPTVILRARVTRNAPPDLAIQAEEYAQLYQMPDVYSPAGSIVEPPLRRERLRQILGINTNEVMWLAPCGDGGFKVERIDDGAFAPLSDWVDYIVHTNADKFNSWARSNEFDYFPFVSTGVEWASRHVAANGDDDDAPKKPRRPRQDRDNAPVIAPTKAASEDKKPKEHKQVLKFEPVADKVVVDKELVKLETDFMALDVAADHPDRMELFGKLGACYARLDRKHEAGLCYSRAVWEANGEDVDAQLNSWINLDLKGDSRGTALTTALKQNTPTIDSIRTVAILAAAADESVTKDVHKVIRWLDDYDNVLDTRTIWLARLGLSNAVGGDTLGLARVRDRVLNNLVGGLSIEKELPTFLRVGARAGSLGNSSSEQLSKTLLKVMAGILDSKRKKSPVEAPVNVTNGYVKLIIANGMAKIGSHNQSRELINEANAELSGVSQDPVHAYLITAFAARAEQAIAGQPSDTPLGQPIIDQLNKIDRVARYKADRMRENSLILEPIERQDAIKAFTQRVSDSRGQDIYEIQAIEDIGKRIKAMDKLIGTLNADNKDTERLVDGLLDLVLRLPAFNASSVITKLLANICHVPVAQQGLLYSKILVVAGHFGMAEVINQTLGLLTTALSEVSFMDLERVLQHSLKALRRVGLRSEINELLQTVSSKLSDSNNDALRAQLALAAGMSYLGDFKKAQPIYKKAMDALNGDTLTLALRLTLSRALAMAWSQAPLDKAITGVTDMLEHMKNITDSFGTNSHYCLSVLNFTESLVLGITSDDLIIGEAGRRFVEDDEHLIRRRLHRDISK
jgi:hypothetical protein